ncbi:PepSY domain-containing protein [Evansella clarkii]|uniref:PepSY domain-containing protein n=1 Tax=Evansella clarkii TaxID=79879 RepID=UPI0009967A99|nr:PepSY domain-containing protein [Evansella clarkii]
MKKLTLILTGAFIIGGTSMMAFAGDDVREASIPAANLTTATEPTEIKNGNEDNGASQISKEEAASIALSMLDGKVEEVELDREDGILIYEVEIEYRGNDYDFDIDAQTGEVLKIDDDLLKTPLTDSVSVSVDEAVNLVKEQFPDGEIDDIELEVKNSRFVYEIEVEVFDEDGDVYVDAETGEIVKIDSDLKKVLNKISAKTEETNSSVSAASSESVSDESGRSAESSDNSDSGERISAQQAGEIALNHIGKGYIDDIELEKKKGTLLYEVEIEFGDDDAEVYIDAFTGEVVYVDYD